MSSACWPRTLHGKFEQSVSFSRSGDSCEDLIDLESAAPPEA